MALFPGGFGTHDEGFEVLTLLQTGKCQPLPLVLLDQPRGTYWSTWHRYIEDHLLRRSMISPEDLVALQGDGRVDEAVARSCSFYRVYHSMRYVKEHLVIRLQRAVAAGGALAELGASSPTSLKSARIDPCSAVPGRARRSRHHAPAAPVRSASTGATSAGCAC